MSAFACCWWAAAGAAIIRIDFAHLRLKPYYYLWIFKGGLPSLARQGLASVATICLNQAAAPFGDAAIAAMGVVQRIAMFGGSAMIGFGQGFQPVCGFNYGAGLYRRVREGFWFSVRVTFTSFAGCQRGWALRSRPSWWPSSGTTRR